MRLTPASILPKQTPFHFLNNLHRLQVVLTQHRVVHISVPHPELILIPFFVLKLLQSISLDSLQESSHGHLLFLPQSAHMSLNILFNPLPC